MTGALGNVLLQFVDAGHQRSLAFFDRFQCESFQHVDLAIPGSKVSLIIIHLDLVKQFVPLRRVKGDILIIQIRNVPLLLDLGLINLHLGQMRGGRVLARVQI